LEIPLERFKVDRRVYFNSDKDHGSSGFDFILYNSNTECFSKRDGIFIYEDYFYSFFWAIDYYCDNFDWYGKTLIDVQTFEKILDLWQFICEANKFDDVFEKLYKVNYTTKTISQNSSLYNINCCGADVWKYIDIDLQMLKDVRRWFDKCKTKCTHIKIVGP
jgi:hypothetical protein